MPSPPDEQDSRARSRIELVVIVAFTVGIGLIRLPHLGYSSLWYDEAAQVLAAEGILQYGYPAFPTGYAYRHGILNSYLMALVFSFFGVSEVSARIASVIFSALTLPLVYFLGKNLGDKRAGVIATVLVAFSSWAAAWARQARMYAQFQFFYFLTMFLFHKTCIHENMIMESRISLRDTILLVISFLLATSSHWLAFAILPSLLVYLFITKGVRWIKNRNFIFLAVFLAVLTIGFYYFAIGVRVPQFQLNWFRHNLLMAYDPFYTRYPVLSLFVVMGFSIVVLKKNKNLIFLYANFLVPLHLMPLFIAGIGGLGFEVFNRYLFFLLPIFALLASFSLLLHVDSISNAISQKIADFADHLNKERIKKTVTIVIIVVVVLPVVSNLYVGFFVPNSQISPTEAFSYLQPAHREPWIDIEYAGFRVACEFVHQYYQKGDAILSTQHLPTYYYLREVFVEENASFFYLMQRRGVGTVDRYLNSTIINTLNELEDTLYAHDRVWVIVDERFVQLYAHPYEVIEFIFENAEIVYDNQAEAIQVYLWSADLGSS